MKGQQELDPSEDSFAEKAAVAFAVAGAAFAALGYLFLAGSLTLALEDAYGQAGTGVGFAATAVPLFLTAAGFYVYSN